MLSYSHIVLLGFHSIHALIILAGLSLYFPLEILTSTIQTITPWYLAGFTAMVFIPCICIEPILIRRICLAILAISIISFFYYSDFPGAYQTVYYICTALVISLIPISYVSLERFKNGV